MLSSSVNRQPKGRQLADLKGQQAVAHSREMLGCNAGGVGISIQLHNGLSEQTCASWCDSSNLRHVYENASKQEHSVMAVGYREASRHFVAAGGQVSPKCTPAFTSIAGHPCSLRLPTPSCCGHTYSPIPCAVALYGLNLTSSPHLPPVVCSHRMFVMYSLS